MLKIKKIRDILGTKVFTDAGDYFGEVEEVNLLDNKIDGWRIKIARDSSLTPYLGKAKGLIVPHQFVKAIGEVMIVNRTAVPAKEEKIEGVEEVKEEAEIAE